MPTEKVTTGSPMPEPGEPIMVRLVGHLHPATVVERPEGAQREFVWVELQGREGRPFPCTEDEIITLEEDP